MIKIMIVDDVPIFLEYMRGCIDWGSYGFEICAEASDGREALKLMESCAPDIVLTDITMPHVDGLSLAETIMNEYPGTAVILITGNNEFEYARRAVKLGVCDYIVKPFEKEELIFSLLKLQDNIALALEAKSEREAFENEKREKVLRKLLLGRGIEGYDYASRLEKEGIHFESPFFMVCVMRFGQAFAESPEATDNWEDIIVPMIRGKVGLSDGLIAREVLRDFENNVCIVLNFDTEESMKSYRIYELEDLSKVVKEQLGINAPVGVSGYCYGMTEVSKGYSEALHVQSGANDKPHYTWESVHGITKALEQLDEDKVKALLREEMARIRIPGDKDYELAMYAGLLTVLLTNLVKAGRNVEDIFGKDFVPYRYLKSAGEGRERELAIEECYLKAIRYRKKNSDSKSRTVAENARAYIEKNHSNPELSVTDVARELLINQTYLRSMFKQEIGLTVSEYITRFRMEKAKKMLVESEFKISEIAEAVGYSDVSYFSKSFKKYFGVSPKAVSG